MQYSSPDINGPPNAALRLRGNHPSVHLSILCIKVPLSTKENPLMVRCLSSRNFLGLPSDIRIATSSLAGDGSPFRIGAVGCDNGEGWNRSFGPGLVGAGGRRGERTETSPSSSSAACEGCGLHVAIWGGGPMEDRRIKNMRCCRPYNFLNEVLVLIHRISQAFITSALVSQTSSQACIRTDGRMARV